MTEKLGSAKLDVSINGAPIVYSPGDKGWPDAPKVTQAEVLLFRSLAPAMRILGQATAAAQDAYALACKDSHDNAMPEDLEQEAMYTAVIELTYRLQEMAVKIHRDVAGQVLKYGEIIARHNEKFNADQLAEADS